MHPLARSTSEQAGRNAALLADTALAASRIDSHVLPFRLDLSAGGLSDSDQHVLAALEKRAATLAIRSLISLAQAGDIDHLGGGLELIPALLATLAVVDYEHTHFAIEHGHTSIGYYSALSVLGFIPEERVIERFRRSLDIAGHVSWVPGGTPLGSGRLGVMVPVSTGLALGVKARKGDAALVICHTGDAGWISGQALNGFIAASVHQAPLMLVMHRNGIQLSGTTRKIIDRDPRPMIAAMGVEILEIRSLMNRVELVAAYGEAASRARAGRPTLIYPVGYGDAGDTPVTVKHFGEMYGISTEVEAFATAHGVALDRTIHVPGSLMSYRDVKAMIECVFYVNDLPGGEAHHDGGMKGRDGSAVLANPMLQLTHAEESALQALRQKPKRTVITEARPPKGTPNLPLTAADVKAVTQPGTDKWVSARAGSEAAYAAIAKKYPDKCFFVSCDLNPSTKIGKAAALVPASHRFELSIQEQAASLVNDGLSFATLDPQLNVFGTFAAFMEGIAREGFELWTYQRNLNGLNEGLNVVMHLAHVGSNTGRDHFSGWSLDWVNFAIRYLPYLRRFYAPADARAAFIAVRDAAAAFGGHIVAIPRDNLPVLTKADSNDPLWTGEETWEPVSRYRTRPGARVAVVALGAPSYLAGAASDALAGSTPSDVFIVNGLPLDSGFAETLSGYDRIITIEDGLIGTIDSGLRGLAGLIATSLYDADVELDHFGIVDPHLAPSEHFIKVWEHYGLTQKALEDAIKGHGGRG